MKARCIRIFSPATERHEIESHPAISIGETYPVLEVYFNVGRSVKFRIVGRDVETPAIWPADMFELVDGTIPAGWAMTTHDGLFVIGPAALSTPAYWERYFDREPLAVEAYRAVVFPDEVQG